MTGLGNSKMSENFRSQVVTQGVQRSPNRAMLRAVGFQDEDFTKAIVGIANGYSTITPCNMGINKLAERAEAGVRSARQCHNCLARSPSAMVFLWEQRE